MAPDQDCGSSQVEKPLESGNDHLEFKVCQADISSSSPVKVASSSSSPPPPKIAQENGVKTDEEEDNNKPVSAPVDDDVQVPDLPTWPAEQVRLEWLKVQKVGAGLANLGNTCFLNTVIQCLTYCPPLANYLLLNDHSSSCKCYDFCMMCELQKHMKEALQHSGDVIKPIHIYENLKLIADHFQSGQQEDAHEFLRFVIENLRRASLCSYSNGDSMDPSVRETTIINYIFGGYNRSQVVCLRCKKKSSRYEHFMDFILDIKHNANTLEKALEQFVKPELLEEDNAYQCPKCNILVPAEKTSTIHRAPNVATIQLKRFDYNKSHGGKITKHVAYPEELNLRPFMSENTGSPLMYKLNAVLVHVGQNCNSGHYYCYIRNSNGSWYLMDDAKVQRVGLNSVLNQQAYVLFYVRVPTSNGVSIENGSVSVPNGINGEINNCVKNSSASPAHKSSPSKGCSVNNRNSFMDRARNYSFPRNRFQWTNHSRNKFNHSRNHRSAQKGTCSQETDVKRGEVSPYASSRNGETSLGKSNGVNRHQTASSPLHCNLNMTHIPNGHHNFVTFEGSDATKQSSRNTELVNAGKENILNHTESSHAYNHAGFHYDEFYAKNKGKQYFERTAKDGPHRVSHRFHFSGSQGHGDNRFYSGQKSYMCGNDKNFKTGCHNDWHYVCKAREPLAPCHQGSRQYNWNRKDSWQGVHGVNDQQYFQNSNGWHHPDENLHCFENYHGKKWNNRNGGFQYSHRYSYDESGQHGYIKEKNRYHKFHSKSRSAEFFNGGHSRYHPYQSWNHRMEESF